MEIWDYIIVGGGIAGLSIAEHLCKKHRVLLLEKYGQWGGRIATDRFPATDTVPALQYEAGAGRIFHTHRHVRALVKRFKLHTYPISSESFFETYPNPFRHIFAPIRKHLQALSKKQLANHTIYELLPESIRHILHPYPYWAEVQLMRADVALLLFADDEPMESSNKSDFFGVVEGLDSLITHLYKSVKSAGTTLENHHAVEDIRRAETKLLEVLGQRGKKGSKHPFIYTTRNVVIATQFTAFGGFSVLRTAPILKQLAMSKLLRIYAVYPPSADGIVWFTKIQKTVTTNPLRYVIPINPKTGLIMISYTEGPDTDIWRSKEGQELEDAIQSSVHTLFPELDIPKPVFLKKHDWIAGCTYWLPGDYDVAKASRAAHHPAPNVYACGESISQNQTWIEGALESVEVLKSLL